MYKQFTTARLFYLPLACGLLMGAPVANSQPQLPQAPFQLAQNTGNRAFLDRFYLTVPQSWTVTNKGRYYELIDWNLTRKEYLRLHTRYKLNSRVHSSSNNALFQILVKAELSGKSIQKAFELKDGWVPDRYFHLAAMSKVEYNSTQEIYVVTFWVMIFDPKTQYFYVLEFESSVLSLEDNLDIIQEIVQSFEPLQESTQASAPTNSTYRTEQSMDFVSQCAKYKKPQGVCNQFWIGEHAGNLKESIEKMGLIVRDSQRELAQLRQFSHSYAELFRTKTHRGYVNHYLALKNMYARKHGKAALIKLLQSIKQADIVMN
jgi:hypothetical protein